MSSDQGFFSDVRGPVVPGGGLGKLAWDHRDASLGALPVFTATDDPGPSFGALLSGVGRDWRSAWMPAASAAGSLQQGRDRVLTGTDLFQDGLRGVRVDPNLTLRGGFAERGGVRIAAVRHVFALLSPAQPDIG